MGDGDVKRGVRVRDRWKWVTGGEEDRGKRVNGDGGEGERERKG